MKLSMVIAAYNERENIEEVTRRLDRVLRALPQTQHEMIFAVAGRDGTREILEGLAAELGRIRVLYEENPSGLGSAFRSGFAAVAPDADLVLTMDADLNHQPEEIPRLLEEMRLSNADVLVGSRFVEGSRSEGIPFWKRAISALMNRVIASLFDVDVKDKTSGFRIYRAAALRQLAFYRNDDFAFLPEILIRATELGMKVAESPIHFTFRTRGESKMSISQTSRSYLALLRTRFDGWSLTALAFLCLGVIVRLLYAFPVHKYAADADSLLSAMRAFDIREGDLRVFYSYVRIGALESYMHVVAFFLFGVSRGAITLAPLFSGFLALLAFFFLVRELFGRKPACFALLFFALPSPAYIAWTYMPNGYPETLLFCLTTLYFAARLARTGEQSLASLALGISAGLGFWNSIQTLVCAGPAVLWLLLRRRELLRSPRFFLRAGAGFLLGAAPWITYNVVYPLASLEGNFATRPVHRAGEVLSNALYLLRYNVPELALGMDPLGDGKPLTALQGALQPAAAAVYVLSGIVLAAATLLSLSRGGRDRGARIAPSSFLLLWMIAGTIAALYVFSEAGQTRGLTVRYVLPLYIVLSAALGLFVFLVVRRSRIAAGLLASAVIVFNVAGFYMPWTPDRGYLAGLASLDQKLVTFLESKHIRWVCGNYWVVYPLIFLSEERVLGLPFQPEFDHYGYARALSGRSTNWALVARDPNFLASWVKRAGLQGQTVSVVPGFHIFLPDSRERSRAPRDALALLRKTAPWGH